jgi:hypothetical protein
MQVRVEPIEPFTDFQYIKIDRSSRTKLDAETQHRVDQAWAERCARNPKYFDGPILVFDRFDAQEGVIHARVDRYKHHAVRETVDLGLSLLATTAMIATPDRDRDCTLWLLGKRSNASHAYPGQWELGPSGGIDPPKFRRRISARSLLKLTDKEVREEVGLSVQKQPFSVRALVHDPIAGSTDVAIAIPFVVGTPSITTNWEYDDTRWVTFDELIAWCDDRPDELIPTTIALARYLDESRH